jgi:hypothetical protein
VVDTASPSLGIRAFSVERDRRGMSARVAYTPTDQLAY